MNDVRTKGIDAVSRFELRAAGVWWRKRSVGRGAPRVPRGRGIKAQVWQDWQVRWMIQCATRLLVYVVFRFI